MIRQDKKRAGGFLRAVAVFMVLVLILTGMPMDVYAQSTDTYYSEYSFRNMYREEDEAIVREAMKQFYAYDYVNDKKYYYLEAEYKWNVFVKRNVWCIRAEGIPKGIRVELRTKYGDKEMVGNTCIDKDSFYTGTSKSTTLEYAYVKDGEDIIEVVYGDGIICMDDEELEIPVKTGYAFSGWVDADGEIISFPTFLSSSDRIIYASWTLHQHNWNVDKWSYNNVRHWHECIGEGTCDITLDRKKDGYAGHTMGQWVEVVEATAHDGGVEERKCTTCDYTEERETDKLPGLAIHFYNYDAEDQVDYIIPLFYVTDTKTGREYYYEKFEDVYGKWHMIAYVPRNTSFVLQTKQGVVLDRTELMTSGGYYNAGLYTVYFKDGEADLDTIYSWTNPDYGYITEDIVDEPEKAGYVFNGWKLEDGTKITFPIHPYYTDGWDGYTLNVYADWVEHDHDFTGREEIAKKPTCTEKGVRWIYCAKDGCGKYIEEAIDILPHSYKLDWEYDTENHYHACEDCGIHEEDFVHNMSEWNEVTPAGFKVDGLEKRECTMCEYAEEKRIPKLSESHIHDFVGSEEVVDEPSCTEEGLKKVYCTEPECGEYIEKSIGKKEHSYKDDWEFDSTYHYHTCEVCGNHKRNLTHDMGEWMEVTPASFMQDGAEKRECETCDYEENRRIPKLSESHIHDFAGKEEVIDAASCTEVGLKKIYCTETECGEWIEEGIDIVPHKYKTEWESDAEYHYHVCEVCGIHEADIAHDFTGKEEVIDAASCTEEGLKKIYCTETECGASIEVPIMMTEHVYGSEWEYDGEAHYRSCELCGMRSDEHQHQYGEGVIVKTATEEEEGLMEWKCGDCGYIISKTIQYVAPEKPKEEPSTSPEEPTLDQKPTIKEEPVVEQVPYTGDMSPVKMYATLAMIAGFAYILCMFTNDLFGMSQEEKEHIIKKLIRWGKGRNIFIRGIAIAMMFFVLVYYHAVGKKLDVNEYEKAQAIE